MSFGENLRRIRKDRGLTQVELSRKMEEKYGCPYYRTNITKWENGTHEPSAETIASFAKFFGVSVDYLVGTGSDEVEDMVTKMKDRPLIRKLAEQLLKENDDKVLAICRILDIDISDY